MAKQTAVDDAVLLIENQSFSYLRCVLFLAGLKSLLLLMPLLDSIMMQSIVYMTVQ